MGIFLKNASNEKLAKSFLDFALTGIFKTFLKEIGCISYKFRLKSNKFYKAAPFPKSLKQVFLRLSKKWWIAFWKIQLLNNFLIIRCLYN